MAAVPPAGVPAVAAVPIVVDPAEIVRDVLAITGLSNNGVNVNNRQTSKFANANGIYEIEDFAALEPTQVKETIKQYQKAAGSTIAGIRVQNNLQGLIWYARDMERRNQAIDINDIDEDVLKDARDDYLSYLKELEAGTKITELDKFDPKKDFTDWDDNITEKLGRIMGSQSAGIHYVIRPTLAAGFTPQNDKEILRYDLPLAGRKYDKDNSTVFSMLAQSTLGTQAWTYVNEYKDTLDGRRAMIALRDHYDGDASNNKKLTKYQRIISDIEYSNERQATWENQSNTLMKAYQWLETRANQKYTDEIKVLKLASMIKVTNNNSLSIAVEMMKSNYQADFNGALIYITSRINELNASKPSAGTRHISSTQRKTRWNGVDISNPTRKFQLHEWDQLQQAGQDLVNQYRNEERSGNFRHDSQHGRGGGRGYGRGGRGRGGRGTGRGHGGHGYGGRGYRAGRGYGRGGPGRGGRGRGDKDNERTAQEVKTDDQSTKKPDDAKSKDPPNPKGGNAGVHFV